MNFFQIFLVLATIQSSVMALSFIVTSKVYMDIKHKKQPMGRIVFGLFGKRAPKAVANFRHICTKGINGTTYVGSEFHRIVSRFIIQGGDIVNRDGTGSTSIYGDFFEDEALDIEHIRPGYLGMANRGPDTNGCQFYVTTVVAKWLDGKHSVFGKVMEGMDVVQTINDVKTDRDNHPIHPVIISNCGEIPTEEFEYYPDDFNIWGWVKSAGLPVISSFCILLLFHYFFRQLNMYC